MITQQFNLSPLRGCTRDSGWSVGRWMLEVYILATSKVISGRVPTCDSAHSWRIYSAAPLGDQVTSTMT